MGSGGLNKDLRNSALKAIGIMLFVPLTLAFVTLLIDHPRLSNEKSSPADSGVYIYPSDFNKPVSNYFSYFIDTFNNVSVRGAIHKHKLGLFKRWDDPKPDFNLGLFTSDLWFYLKVKNEGNLDNCFAWQLFYNCDSARLYCINDSAINSHPSIAYLTPRNGRVLPIRAVFDTVWLGAHEERELYLHLAKNHYNTYIPMRFLTLTELLLKENVEGVVYASFIAVVFLVFLLNIFLFFQLRQTINLWYAIYAISACMLFLLNSLFSALILPGPVYRVIASAETMPYVDFAVLGSARVMQLFLAQNRRNSLFYQPLIYLCVMDAVWGVLQLTYCSLAVKFGFFCPFFMLRFVNDILTWATLIFMCASMIEKIIQKKRFAIPYFCFSMFPTISVMNYFINSLGFADITFLNPNGFFAGIFLEIVFLYFLLTTQYTIMQQEKEQLLQQKLILQEEMNARITATQESEQRRIAADLHDGLGSSLTALRIMVNKAIHYFTGKGQPEPAGTLLNVQGQLDNSIAELQTISHNLIPKDFEQHEFTGAIRNYLDNISTNAEVNAEYCLDQGLNDVHKSKQIILFRIFTELLNNAIKHSACANLTVQFLIHQNTIQLLVEDDGKGFDVTKEAKGMGLKNMRSRVDSLGGNMIVDSSEGGTTCIIEIPLG